MIHPQPRVHHRPCWKTVEWRVCVCVYCSTSCQSRPIDSPKCNTAHLHTPRAPCRIPIPQLLSFSMNAQVCNLPAANWIRINGGFIPSGSAWSLLFHCNGCQSQGGTEGHIRGSGGLDGGGGICSCFQLSVSPPRASHFWSRLPVSLSMTPTTWLLASVLSVFGLSHSSYIYYCLCRHIVHLQAQMRKTHAIIISHWLRIYMQGEFYS